MSKEKRILLFFVLPTIAILAYPPAMLQKGIGLLIFVALVFVALGYLVWIGKSAALTMTIFLQGLNVIVRLMMFFSTAVKAGQGANISYIIFSLAGTILSLYLLLRLDRGDVRIRMVG
jgi:hypothetical protein